MPCDCAKGLAIACAVSICPCYSGEYAEWGNALALTVDYSYRYVGKCGARLCVHPFRNQTVKQSLRHTEGEVRHMVARVMPLSAKESDRGKKLSSSGATRACGMRLAVACDDTSGLPVRAAVIEYTVQKMVECATI